MKKLVSSLLFSLLCFGALADEVEVVMEDDSYVYVPLNFGFPLYGQVFTHSIMYDNGVVGLYDPTAGTGCNPANMYCAPINWNPQSAWDAYNLGNLNAQSFSYMLAPLWSDIAPDDTTKYYIDSGSDYQKYRWSNMVEFYSIYGNEEQQEGGARYSNFALELRQSGQILTTYGDTDLNTSNVWTGITGNVQAGEINQYKPLIEYGTQVTTGLNIEDWEVSSDGTISETGYDPCPSDPLSSTKCPGYDVAYLAQQCSIDSLYDTTCDGYAQAYIDDKCMLDPLFSPSCIGYSAAMAALETTYKDPSYDDPNTGATDINSDPSSNNGQLEEESLFSGTTGQEDPNKNVDPTNIGGSNLDNTGIDIFESDSGGNEYADSVGPVNDIFSPQAFSAADAISADGEISVEQIAKAATEITDPVAEEEKKILLDDMQITDIFEEEFLEEESVEKELELVADLDPLEEPLAEKLTARPEDKKIVGPRRNNRAISISVRESGELVRNAESASVNSSGSSSQLYGSNDNSGGSGSSGSYFGSRSSFNGEFSAEEQFFASDAGGFGALTGQIGIGTENGAQNEQFTQNGQDMQQNIALGDSAPIGFSISEPVGEQAVMEVPKAPSLAERIAETTRVQNIEDSNAAATGQMVALAVLASGANLNAYYTTLQYTSLIYQDEQVYSEAKILDNTSTHYNLFSKSYGIMQTMIRSQYK